MMSNTTSGEVMGNEDCVGEDMAVAGDSVLPGTVPSGASFSRPELTVEDISLN